MQLHLYTGMFVPLNKADATSWSWWVNWFNWVRSLLAVPSPLSLLTAQFSCRHALPAYDI